MTMTRGVQSWRRAAEVLQAVVLLGLPFLRIQGESAFRFDIPSLRLHFFGTSLWMDEFFLVFAAVLFLTFLTVLVTLLFGRVWCGWFCPQTVLVDFTRFVDRLRGKVAAYKLLAYGTTFFISALVAADLIWYFVSPYEFIDRFFAGTLGAILWGFWIVLTAILFLNYAFLRHTFCATVCPYAKLQSVLCDGRTLTIAFDTCRAHECIECNSCVRACPVGIDIRKGASAACINCAECIDACVTVLGRKQKEGLIGYFFGRPGETGKLLRQNVMLIASVTLASLIFFLYLTLSRAALDVTVLPNPAFAPRTNTEGTVINSYLLALQNKSGKTVRLRIRADGARDAIKVTPDSVI
ncbi:MAG TPA: 4Fe-4S dicluster domain-containing protein, partial [Dissulfurispiraceae bacterium]|nr:4Fe-4S dicluster domain-containing protein [Dissulfurispiraceae bacterium]